MDPTTFVREAYQELRKATWLSRQQALGSTVVVIVLTVLLAIFAGAVDFILSTFMKALLGS